MPQSQAKLSSSDITIATPKEFDFRECLKFLGRSDQERLHFIENDKIRKLLKLHDKKLLLELSCRTNNAIEIKLLNSRVEDSTKIFIKNYVREWFDLETDLALFYKIAAKDKLLKNLVHRFYGLRLIKIYDFFQALCWAIFGQQINLAFAYTLYRRFIENYGEKLTYKNQDYWLFPNSDIIAGLSVAELMKLQLTGKKSEYIIGLAGQIEEGNLSKESLLEKSDFNEAKNDLVKIRGIGPWTANYVLMRCLGDPSAFPIEDVGLHNAIKLQLNLEQKPTIEEIRNLAAGWTNWQAYATFYLYRSLV
ncbi:MAG: DNA-3-methyladenine glycosylase 2 family protein [Caldithrix sp.]|nr:MAG: DNA-3-methyladenine glycosylase 2 family protein [Caldithrix sp.]